MSTTVEHEPPHRYQNFSLFTRPGLCRRQPHNTASNVSQAGRSSRKTVYVSAPPPSYQVDSAPAAPTLTADERQQALDREFGLTDEQKAAALDDHNAQQLAWCADTQSAYCDMVRQAAQQP